MALDEDVTGACQAQKHFHARGRFEVDNDGALSPRSWIERAHRGKWARVRAIDPNHFRPEVGKHHAGKRHGTDTRQLHHLYSGERAASDNIVSLINHYPQR